MSERGWVDLMEMNRIGIAIRGGASKQGYFDYKAAIYASEGWSRKDGEAYWDESAEWHEKNPAPPGVAYAPVCDFDFF